eukprot:6214681-Pleurochrysis_carterae.AAC.4
MDASSGADQFICVGTSAESGLRIALSLRALPLPLNIFDCSRVSTGLLQRSFASGVLATTPSFSRAVPSSYG